MVKIGRKISGTLHEDLTAYTVSGGIKSPKKALP